MTIFVRVCFVIVCAFMLSCEVRAELHFCSNHPDEVEVMRRAQKLVKQGKWSQIEKWLIECEEKRLRMDSGELQMMFVHYAVSADQQLSDKLPDKRWMQWLAKVKKWEKVAKRKDIVAAVKIEFWGAYAWKARGTEFANKVNADQWKVFRERLAVMEELYEEVKKEENQYPWFHKAALTLALGQSWSNERTYEEVLQPGIRAEPENLTLLRNYAYRLQPRWYGKKGDDYRFFKDVVARYPSDLGDEMYARLLLRNKLHEIINYKPDLVDWDAMKSGVEILIQKYPKATQMMEFFMSFAERHGEFEEGVELLARANPEAFENFSKSSPYGSVLHLSTELESELERVNYFKPKPNVGSDNVGGVAWLPSGEQYLVSSGFRGVHLFHRDAVQSSDRFVPSDERPRLICHVVLSPDGKHIAVSSHFDLYYGYEDSRVYILEVVGEELKLVKELKSEPRAALELCFSGDGKRLYQSHYITKSRNKGVGVKGVDVCLWQKEDAKFEPLIRHKNDPSWIFDVQSLPDSPYTYVTDKGVKRYLDSDLTAPPVDIISKEHAEIGVISDMEFLLDGKYFVLLQRPGQGSQFVCVYETEGGALVAREKMKIKGHSTDAVTSSALDTPTSADFFIVGPHGGLLRLRFDTEARTVEVVSADYGNGQKFYAVMVSPAQEGKVRVTAGSADGMVGNWDVALPEGE